MLHVNINNMIKDIDVSHNSNMTLDIIHIKREPVAKNSYYTNSPADSSGNITTTVARPTKCILIGTNTNKHFDIKNAVYCDIVNNRITYADSETVSDTSETSGDVLSSNIISIEINTNNLRLKNISTSEKTFEFTILLIGYVDPADTSSSISTSINNSIRTIKAERGAGALLDIGIVYSSITHGTYDYTAATFNFPAKRVLCILPATETTSHLGPQNTVLFKSSGGFNKTLTSNGNYSINTIRYNTTLSTKYMGGIKINNGATTGSHTFRFIYIAYSTLPDPNIDI